MDDFLIPLSGIPESFTITLGDKEVRLIVKYNELCGWVLDILDAPTDTMILSGINLVTGVDLLEPFTDCGISGSLVIYTDGDLNADPTFDTLGKTSNLYYVTV